MDTDPEQTLSGRSSLQTIYIYGGQSGVTVTRSHGNDQDVGSNPTTDRNENTHNGQTPAQKVPQ